MNIENMINRIVEDISISCIGYCPICDASFDAENKEDDFCLKKVEDHIRLIHTIKEIKEYLK